MWRKPCAEALSAHQAIPGFAGVACLFSRLPTPPLACFSAPLPRRGRIAPRPPSPTGKGEIFSFLMQGASPLASPRLSRKRHGLNLQNKYPMGACLFGCPLTPPLACFPTPIPPPPFPAGRGRFWVFLCKGLRPLHPRGLNGRGTGSARWKPSLGALPGRRKPVPQKSQLPARHLYGRICKCRRRFSAGVAGAGPPRQKTKNFPPFPAGEGGRGGIGGRIKTKGRVGGQPKRLAPAGTGARHASHPVTAVTER